LAGIPQDRHSRHARRNLLDVLEAWEQTRETTHAAA
jgi:hypothetical protein